MVETRTENKISLAFQNLSITSDKDYNVRFESIVKTFQPKILFAIIEIK